MISLHIIKKEIYNNPIQFRTIQTMHITLLTAGKIRGQLEEPLLNQYIRQCGWSINIREIQAPKYLSGTDLQNAEAKLFEPLLQQSERIIALDERGKNMKSLAFANLLGAWRDDGIRKLTLIIGGADGLSSDIRHTANLVLSFGTLTWPHRLVRVMAAEQLYRAWSILNHHPYHRE